jgi:hypothetical protein
VADPDLAAYLRARWDEDEAAARAATPGPWIVKDVGDREFTSDDDKGWWWVWQEAALPHYGGVIQIDHTPGAVGVASITDARQGAKERADAEHIARWDPAAVLADIAAKRTLLAPHAGYHDCTAHGSDCSWTNSTWYREMVLPALLAPFATRDDFDPSWRTSG